MSIRSKHYVIPVFIPMLGCRHKCFFCNQNTITGKYSPPTENEVRETIENHLNSFKNAEVIEMAFFGGSFTGLSYQQMKKYLDWIKPYRNEGRIDSVRLSTRPDYISIEILDFLKDYGVKTIELGAQSMDDNVLKNSGRGHTSYDTSKASELVLKKEFVLGLQMMTGLPGDTHKKCLHTAKSFIKIGASEARIYPTIIIKGTRLEEMFLNKTYSPQTTKEAITILTHLIQVFEENNVKILRIGLHPSETLFRNQIVAGPDQHNLRDKAMSKIWSERFIKLKGAKEKCLTISVNSSQLNFAAGYKKSNRIQLEQKFKQVRFNTDNSLNGAEFSYHID